MNEERILTLNPKLGKSGTRISKVKYEQLRTAIIESLQEAGQLTFSELRDEVEKKLAANFDGSISWYYTTVKLDLEARGLLTRIGKESPQKLQLGTPKH